MVFHILKPENSFATMSTMGEANQVRSKIPIKTGASHLPNIRFKPYFSDFSNHSLYFMVSCSTKLNNTVHEVYDSFKKFNDYSIFVLWLYLVIINTFLNKVARQWNEIHQNVLLR